MGERGRPSGDWICPNCNEHNFANKLQCFTCKVGAPPAAGRVMDVKPADLRPGDWICNSCGTHNFANKVNCFRCSGPSPQSGAPPLSPQAPAHTHAHICLHAVKKPR
jgi:hypothetical protein